MTLEKAKLTRSCGCKKSQEQREELQLLWQRPRLKNGDAGLLLDGEGN